MPIVANAEMNEEKRAALQADFETAAANQDGPAADRIVAALLDEAYTPGDWTAVFGGVYANGGFDNRHRALWNYIVNRAGDASDRAAELSGLAAVESLGDGLRGPDWSGQDPAATLNALTWIQQLGNLLGEQRMSSVFDALLKAAQGSASGTVPAPGLPRVESAAAMRVGIQLCLTVAEYSARNERNRQRAAEALGLTGPGGRFWIRSGAFLFDNGALNEGQLASLTSLASSIPIELHRVVAVSVPEGLQGDPAQLGFATSGQMIGIDAIPMEAMSDPGEWQPDIARPVAPLFTIRAAQQYVRAIQQIQFSRRPELGLRLGTIIQKAGTARSTYLLRSSRHGRYANDPAALMPDTAYLWFIDSENTLVQAMQHWRITIKSPMDQFLLFADMMSGGTGSTVLFHTSPDGAVNARNASVGRVRLEAIQPPGLVAPIIPTAVSGPVSYVNEVQMPRRPVRFRLDSLGLADSLAGP